MTDNNECSSPAPPGFLLHFTAGGQRYALKLTVPECQWLVLELLQQPGVGNDVAPSVVRRYLESKAETAAQQAHADAEFLTAMGVTL